MGCQRHLSTSKSGTGSTCTWWVGFEVGGPGYEIHGGRGNETLDRFMHVQLVTCRCSVGPWSPVGYLRLVRHIGGLGLGEANTSATLIERQIDDTRVEC